MRKSRRKPTKFQRIKNAIRNLRELGYSREKIRQIIRKLEEGMEAGK